MKRCIALSVVVLMTGCRTVDWVSQRDQELPADTLKRIALQIERAVQRGDRDPVIADRDGIVVNSDEVRQAIRARAARSELLNEIRDTGHAWERRDGLLYLRRTKEFKAFGTPGLRQRYASVVFHENDSRWTLYESILRDGDFPGVRWTRFA